MKTVSLLLALLPSLASAQIDSLKQYLQYYPLQNGNYWEYVTVSHNDEPPFETDSSAYSIMAVGDTLLSNGLRYEALDYRNLYPDHRSFYIFERIDSSSGNVFRYDSTSVGSERRIDSLYAAPGDTFPSSPKTPGVSGSAYPYFETVCISMEDYTILGVATEVKIFMDLNSLYEFTYTLARGFGLYNLYDEWDFGYTSTTLVYARIGGNEYGTKIPTSVIECPIVVAVFTLFQNYPNPFNPSTTIRYQLPERATVTLRVYDILGREVETLMNGPENSGLHLVTFNANKLPSGVYFYTLHAGTYSDTKKLLLLK